MTDIANIAVTGLVLGIFVTLGAVPTYWLLRNRVIQTMFLLVLALLGGMLVAFLTLQLLGLEFGSANR